MRSLGRLMLLAFTGMFFLHGWQTTTAPEYAGPAVWGLLFAGLFWLGVVVFVQELVHVARRHWTRTRSGAHARH